MENEEQMDIKEFFAGMGKTLKEPKNMSTLIACAAPVYGEFHSYLTGKNEWDIPRAIGPALFRAMSYSSALNFLLYDSTTVSERASFALGCVALTAAANMAIYVVSHKKPIEELANDYKAILSNEFSDMF